jgi:hypothetical protein
MERIPPIVKTFENDKKSITLNIPNVRYAKENHLLIKANSFTHEILLRNMAVCGFDVVSTQEHKGAHTYITTKCCNLDCDGTSEKRYCVFIQNERLPLCKSCQAIIKGINKSNKRPIVAIKGGEKIEFSSIADAGRALNISQQQVYNHLKRGTPHKSGYKFEFLD